MAAGDIFAFPSGKRRVIDDKMHGNGRLRDLLERNRNRIVRGAECVADMDIRDAGDSHDRADAGLLHIYLI